MKLFDNKGNLFGRLNVIDFFLVIFIVMSFSLLAVSYRGFNMREHRSEGVIRPETVKIKLECLLVPDEIASAIKVGDKDVRRTKDFSAVVESVDLSRPRIYMERTMTGLSKLEAVNIERYKNLVLTLKIEAQKRADEYYYIGQYLKINNKLNFVTPLYEVEGRIVAVQLLGRNVSE